MRWRRVVRFGGAASAGAAVMHVVEYHLGLGFLGPAGDRWAAIEYMVDHCPLFGTVGIVLVLAATVAGAAVLTMFRQLAHLRRLEATGARLPAVHGNRSARWDGTGLRHISVYWLAIALAQTVVFALANRVVPMQYVMNMRGGSMVMGATLPVPLAPLTLFLAAIITILILKFERRLTTIAAAIAALIRQVFDAPHSVPLPPAGVTRRLPAELLGPAVFSRPPPFGTPA